MHSTVVVFPAPLAPARPTISPARTSRSRPSTTTLVPYLLRRPRTVTTPRSVMSSLPLGGGAPAHRPVGRTGPLTLGRGGYGRRRDGDGRVRRNSVTAADRASSAAPYGPATQTGHGEVRWPVGPLTRAQTTTLINTAGRQNVHNTLSAAGRAAKQPPGW